MALLLEAVGLVKRFPGTVALDGFDLEVHAGEIVGLVGHNGAGKTTFARATVGLIRPDAGAVRVGDIDVARSPGDARTRIGLAPQELSLYPTATARENLQLFAGLYGLARRDARLRIERLAEQLLLTDVLDRRVRELSGGQQRRLQTATAMVHRPSVLLLDEPTVGADPITREALLAVVRAAAQEGAAIVYTTHYLPELDTLGATLAVADHGRVVARGERASLLAAVPGQVVIEFDGPPPGTVPQHCGLQVRSEEGRLTITTPDPAAALVPLLAANPEITEHLRAVEVQAPTLDDLYRHLVPS
jgi:ABC-2 type transport system ATP-binding protein